MRFIPCLLFAAAAHAQSDRAAPDCSALTGAATPPPPAPGGSGGDAINIPGSGFLQVVSPPPTLVDLPRNVEIRVAGDLGGLDLDPPTFLFELRAPDSSRVPISRVGGIAHPVDPLDANTTYTIHLETTDANPCPQCMAPQDIGFTTGTEIDTTPPVLDGTPPVNVFVMPDAAEAAKCGLFFSQTHQVIIDFGADLPPNTWIDVAGRTPAGDVKNLTEEFNTTALAPVSTDLGAQLPVALGDEFVIAFTPRDLAGNVGSPRMVRVRARSFVDESKPRDSLSPQWCDLPSGPTVEAPEALPSNGRVQVSFPFEEVPLALRASDNTTIPLVPVDDIEGGHVYDTVLPMPAGQSFDVVTLDCPHCVCPGCAPAPGSVIGDPVSAESVVDRTSPSAPVIKDIGEDVDPAPAVAGPCHPDRPALVVTLAPGKDDVSKPLDLRYDATIRLSDGPTLAIGRSLTPHAGTGGNTELRIETHGIGRVLGQPFTLTLDAIDAAGNRAESTVTRGGDVKTGCTQAGSSTAAVVATLALLLSRRRFRRR